MMKDTTEKPLYQSARETADRLSRRPRPPFTPLRDGASFSFEFFPPKSESDCLRDKAGNSNRCSNYTYLGLSESKIDYV